MPNVPSRRPAAPASRAWSAQRPRGRPRIQETATDIVASVLATAGARVGSSEYSTRRIAQLTGLSQTAVSRAISALRGAGQVDTEALGRPPAAPGTAEIGTAEIGTAEIGTAEIDAMEIGAVEIDAVRVRFPHITVAFSRTQRPAGQHQHRAMQRRAAALMSGLHLSGAVDWTLEGAPPPDGRAPAGPTPSQVSGDRILVTWHPGAERWETFRRRLAALIDQCVPDVHSIPGALLDQVARTAGRGLHGLTWDRRGATALPADDDVFDSESAAHRAAAEAAHASVRQWLPHPGLSVTEQIAIALRQEITNSGFRPGDRLTVSALAGPLKLSAGTVRAGMRRMSDDGLLIHAEGSFFIPAVSGVDIIDLYAARLHLGVVLLRGCARQPRSRLLAARFALAAVEAATQRGTHSEVGHADLQFQHELADASGLAQSARSFHALTLRLRMFISVLQLDYSPATDRILSDDQHILAALLEGRTEDALRIFRSKVHHAVRHMCAVAPDTFDARLWEQLAR